MCGRYALDENARELANHFGLIAVPELTPRYNIAPGTPVPVIRDSPAGPVMEPMVWGLTPAWARRTPAPSSMPKPINARSETVADKPMFREAFRRRRCILPASGFYEWLRPASGAKQPYYIHPVTEPVFAMAGLYEDGDGEHPPSCCILTVSANEVMTPIHDRMPVMLAGPDLARWLAPGSPRDAVAPLLIPAPAATMTAHRVGTRVNSARNDGPELILPAPSDAGP